jgi:hypothetical protein
MRLARSFILWLAAPPLFFAAGWIAAKMAALVVASAL